MGTFPFPIRERENVTDCHWGSAAGWVGPETDVRVLMIWRNEPSSRNQAVGANNTKAFNSVARKLESVAGRLSNLDVDGNMVDF